MHNADCTITIYNAFYDSLSGYDICKRTVVEGVSWHGQTKTTVAGDGGLVAADEFVVRIPSELCGKYVEPKAYTGAVGTWTLCPGDIVVKGAAKEENPRPKELFDKYSEVLTVVGVTDNRAGRGGHLKVVGK